MRFKVHIAEANSQQQQQREQPQAQRDDMQHIGKHAQIPRRGRLDGLIDEEHTVPDLIEQRLHIAA